MQDRAAARDALRARTTGMGLALTVLSAALTGGVTGALARPEPVAAEPVAAEPVVSAAPASPPVPRPRRTVYVRVPAVPTTEVIRRTTRTSARTATRSAPRAPAAPPRPARQPAVTTSSGS